MAFSGLGLHLGNLSRLSNAQTRSISPENFTGEKGKGGMAADGPAARRPAISARAGRSRPMSSSSPARPSRSPTSTGQGAIQQIWMTLARGRLAPLDPAHLLGRPGAADRGMPGRRFLRLRLGGVRAGLVAGGLRQSRPRLQLLLGDAVPQARALHAGELAATSS